LHPLSSRPFSAHRPTSSGPLLQITDSKKMGLLQQAANAMVTWACAWVSERMKMYPISRNFDFMGFQIPTRRSIS